MNDSLHKQDLSLKVAAVARRTGVSVRTLHYYEEIGLLSPSRRTASGHRLYSLGDIQRLQEIRSLKQLGMSLTDIAECFREGRIDARGIIAEHLARVRQEQANLQRLERQLLRLQGFLDADAPHGEQHDGEQPTDVFLNTLETIIMFDKYFTEEQLERLAAHQAEGTETVSPTIEALDKARKSGVTVESDQAKTLLARFKESIEEVADGDESMVEAIHKLLHEQPEARRSHGISEELFGYIAMIAGGAEHEIQ